MDCSRTTLLVVILMTAFAANPMQAENTSSSGGGESTFNKKLGVVAAAEDQLAVESNVVVEHQGPSQPRIPVPLPMTGYSRETVLLGGGAGAVASAHHSHHQHAPPPQPNHSPVPNTKGNLFRGQQQRPVPLQHQGLTANAIFREMFDKQRAKAQRHQQQQRDLAAEGSAEQSLVASAAPDMPKIVSLEVKCEKNVMRVYIAFDQPFYGVVFSKGHYHNVACIHLPAGLGHTSANFDISTAECGTHGSSLAAPSIGSSSAPGSWFENVIVVQYDAQVQEVWDQARKLRCTWHDQYEKSVTFRPFPVDMLDVVRADFAGDNVGCWMQIQVGKGPWASEVTGLVKIGQTMTMVLAIKDEEEKFDMLVRNCLAHDGIRAPVQLVDQFGCITRPKLMSKFIKIKNFGQSASVLSYTHFQAFKFPDSMEVHFQCTIQICRFQCPEQCSEGSAPGGGYKQKRRRRSAQNETFHTVQLRQDVTGLDKTITVVAREDLDFGEDSVTTTEVASEELELMEAGNVVCMSAFGLGSILTILVGCLAAGSAASGYLLLRRRKNEC